MSSKKKAARLKTVRSETSPIAGAAGKLRLEALGIISLFALAVFFLVTSWRKWPDSLIDFGNGLYIAWRLSQGAILYRDVDVDYGPLSQWFNGTLFGIVGPGLMVLAVANLIVFTAIVSILYLLCRRAWGALSAFAASAVFIVVFGFSQSVVFGNYNYVTPYSQETTHGILICLLLVFVLLRWTQKGSMKWTLSAGLLFGLTAILKPEFMLAGAAMIVASVLARWKIADLPNLTTTVVAAIGAVIPTLVFTLYFSAFVEWKQAVAHACHAWLNTARLGGDMAQMRFLGFDHPWEHLTQNLIAVFWAGVFIGVIAAASWLVDRKVTSRAGFVSFTAFLAIGLGLLSGLVISWQEVGRCLFGLMLCYLCFCLTGLYRDKVEGEHSRSVCRLLLCVLATALLTRMILNGRIYQYGYYQAALAAVIVPSIIMGELPAWLALRRRGTQCVLIGCAALIFPGLVILAGRSQHLLHLKTASVGDGWDRFYTYPRQIDQQGEIVDTVARTLRAMAGTRTLLVLPEGAMINYLARLPSPVAPLFFYSGITEQGREKDVVAQLQERPPDSIVIISRDLREYGMRRYGERPGAGAQILQWVNENYKAVAKAGGDPFEFDQRGTIIFRRKATFR